MIDRKAMTLLELLIVVVIIGILAAVGFINYSPIKEKREEKLAQVALKYIEAAEELYNVEYRQYTSSFTPAQLSTLNTNLRLSLDNQDWNYTVTTQLTPPTYTIVATRTNGNGCTETLSKANPDQITASSSCP